MIKKLTLLTFLLISTSVFSLDKLENQFFLYNGIQMTTVNITETDTTNATESTFTYYGVGFEYNYFWNPRFSTGVVYEQGISLSASTTNTSQSLKFTYFFLADGTRTMWNFLNKSLLLSPSLSPYAALHVKKTSYDGETETVNFAGFNFETGVNYLLWENVYVRGQAAYDMQTSGESRTLSSFNFYLGLGIGL